jgi:hypothetical protein
LHETSGLARAASINPWSAVLCSPEGKVAYGAVDAVLIAI